MVNIVQIADKTQGTVLRQKAKLVDIGDIESGKIKTVIDDMVSALEKQDDGIAIAAPQIGISLQIFVVSGKVLKLADETYKGDESNLVFINPKITKYSKEKQEVEEGCLSVRWKYGKIKRADKVNLEAINEKGEKINRGASGLLAQVFQHETDHLHGILFIDSAYDVKEIPPEGENTQTKKKISENK